MSRRNRRALRAPISAAVAVMTGLTLAAGVAAAPGGDRLDAQRERVRALETELSSIDAQAGAAADDHAGQRARERQLGVAIVRNRAAVAAALRKQRRTQERLDERLRAIYTSADRGPLAVLLSSGSLSEAEATSDLIRRVNEHDQELVATLRSSRVQLTAAREKLRLQRAEAGAAAAAAARRMSELNGLLERRRLVLDRARGDLAGLIAARERAAALARAQAAAEQAARQRARAAAPAAGSAPTPAAPAADPTPSTPTTPSAPTPADTPAPTPEPPSGGDGPVAGGPSYATLNRIAQCESGGNPRAVSASGMYRGKYQFAQGTWNGVGGSGDPAAASEAEQDLRAALLYRASGPGPWPICGYR